MTDPKYDKANKVGIENALELLEEELAQHEEEMLSIREDANEVWVGGEEGYEEGLKKAIEIVKLNIPNK